MGQVDLFLKLTLKLKSLRCLGFTQEKKWNRVSTRGNSMYKCPEAIGYIHNLMNWMNQRDQYASGENDWIGGLGWWTSRRLVWEFRFLSKINENPLTDFKHGLTCSNLFLKCFFQHRSWIACIRSKVNLGRSDKFLARVQDEVMTH